MGVKYTIPFKSDDNASWRVDVSLDTWTTEPITVRGVGRQCATLSRDPDSIDDPYSVFIKSFLTVNLYNQGEIDVRELQRATDKQFVVTLYNDETIKFIGYLDAEGIQQQLKTNATVQLVSKDGLGMLEDISYTHKDLPGTTATTSRCVMNYIRQILFATENLGLPLPIRWTNYLECTAFPGEDIMTGGVQWSPNGEGYYNSISGESKSCAHVLEGLLKSMQCRIVQDNGMWIISRINDISTGYVTYKRIAGDLGRMQILSGTENITRQIGRNGYRFVDETDVIINKSGAKTIKAEYKADVKENILPNGDFDNVIASSSILGTDFLYWGTIGNQPMRADIMPPLDGRKGNSAKLTPIGGSAEQPFFYYGLLNPLPIDSNTLVPRISFSFLFSPVIWYTTRFDSDGNPYNNGIVNFEASPFHLQVIYRVAGQIYYLNDYGYWTTDDTEINIVIDGIKLGEVARVAFDKFQGIILPAPPNQPQPGDINDIQIIFRAIGLGSGSVGDQIYIIDNVSITIEDNNDIYEITETTSKNTLKETVELNISSSFSGYMSSNLMTAYYNSPNEFYFKDGQFYTGSLTAITAAAVLRFRHSPSLIYTGSVYVGNKDYSYNEIYLIDSLGQSRFMPMQSSYNIETCKVTLTAIECRNDNVIFTEKFYGSNDKILSN